MLLRSRLPSLQRASHSCYSSWKTSRLVSLLIRQYSQYPKDGVFQSSSRTATTPGLPLSPLEKLPTSFPRSKSWRRLFPRWYNVLGGLVLTGIGYLYILTNPTIYAAVKLSQTVDEAELEANFNELPVVKQLRAEWHLENGEKVPLWREWTAYQGISKENLRKQRLTTGPLGTSYGLATQKVFWKELTHELMVFINFGNGVCGDLPAQVHPGAITTICDEALGRLAIKLTEEKTAVTASLEVIPRRPVNIGDWYVLRVAVDTNKTSTDSKKYVFGVMSHCTNLGRQSDDGRLEDLDPVALLSGLFVMPKNVKLAPIPEDF